MTDAEPLRCRACKRHLVAWDGSFWRCSRLVRDPHTGELGCGRQFVRDVYEGAQEEST